MKGYTNLEAKIMDSVNLVAIRVLVYGNGADMTLYLNSDGTGYVAIGPHYSGGSDTKYGSVPFAQSREGGLPTLSEATRQGNLILEKALCWEEAKKKVKELKRAEWEELLQDEVAVWKEYAKL